MTVRSKCVWGGLWLSMALLLARPAAATQDPVPPPQPPTAQPPTTQPPTTQPATPPPSTSSGQAETSDPDRRLDPLQPDFNLAALPTTLRMPKNKLAFRVTHRFTRSLGRGDFGDLVNDFFGFDSAAQIGLELRYGLLPGTQIGVHRTSDKTIEIFGQQSLMQQKPDGHPLGIDVIATFEGLDNMKDQKLGAIGLLVSRKAGRFAAFYAEPIFVANTNPAETGDNNTTMIGLGTRVRIRPATYLVGEWTPRVSGFRPGVDQGSFGIEMRAGGHLFQINFSNGWGTTLGQLASRGGITADSWFIGFNISRKFF
jgi:Membrane bound beta barrel domain (DUF5777)